MANAQKDTIYIDVDDEITSVIEKLQNAPNRIVALVLPKRAAVLQSVVNMKLLKRSAEQAKKHVVLITSESGLLPLAGAVGMHVASSLQSRPVIPPAPPGSTPLADNADDFDEDLQDDFDPDAESGKPVGQLAGLGAAAPSAFNEPETIQLDNDDTVPESATATGVAATAVAAGAKAKAAKKPRNNKLKVPNFNKFRLLLVAGVLVLLLLIGGFFYASTALSKAVITLKTNSTDIDTKASLTLDPSATEYDPASADNLPAKIVTKQLVTSQQVGTSGQKNNGQKATGEVKMTAGACSADVPENLPAGTGLSANGSTFITQTGTSFVPTISGGKCTYTSSSNTMLTAQAAGASYNIAATSFAVAGRTDITAKSSEAFTGGTDSIVKTVTQSDIASATQKAASQTKDASGVKDELTNKLAGSDYTAITASFNSGEAKVAPSAAVGDAADTVTVTSTTTYSMYGAKEADLKSVVIASVKDKIDTSKQQIIKDGVSSAKYTVATTAASGPVDFTLTATSLAGPDIQSDKLVTQLAGKKTGQVQSTVKAIPGVSDATVSYSPFWVSKVPKNTAHVHIVIEKASGASESADE